MNNYVMAADHTQIAVNNPQKNRHSFRLARAKNINIWSIWDLFGLDYVRKGRVAYFSLYQW